MDMCWQSDRERELVFLLETSFTFSCSCKSETNTFRTSRSMKAKTQSRGFCQPGNPIPVTNSTTTTLRCILVEFIAESLSHDHVLVHRRPEDRCSFPVLSRRPPLRRRSLTVASRTLVVSNVSFSACLWSASLLLQLVELLQRQQRGVPSLITDVSAILRLPSLEKNILYVVFYCRLRWRYTAKCRRRLLALRYAMFFDCRRLIGFRLVFVNFFW